MNFNYIKQIIIHLRQDWVISTITILGTALTIFVIMVVVMMEQVKIAPFPPESNRNRMLYADYISVSINTSENPYNFYYGYMNESEAEEMFKSLNTPEAVSIYACCNPSVVSAPDITPFVADSKETDDIFWKIFDFDFIDGKPYNKEEFDSGRHVAVISKKVALKLFGRENVTGKEIDINHSPYCISGVVRNVSTLAPKAYGEIWIPYSTTNSRKRDDYVGGKFSVVILAKSSKDRSAIQKEATRKIAEYNRRLKKEGIRIIQNKRPYTQTTEATSSASNIEPDIKGYFLRRITIILILLSVPAINLSSMTQSRLRRRTTEIGIRRAFGCTQHKILNDVIMENFILSIVAGMIGLIFCFLFCYFGADLLFIQAWSDRLNKPTVNLSILMQPSTFLYALFFCFVLNLASSIIPAWRISHSKIVNALKGKTR